MFTALKGIIPLRSRKKSKYLFSRTFFWKLFFLWCWENKCFHLILYVIYYLFSSDNSLSYSIGKLLMPFLHFMIFMYSLASLLISSGFFFSPSVFFSCQHKPLFCKHGWRRFFVVFHTEFFLHCVLKICWNIMMTSRVMEETRKKNQNLFNRILYTAVYKFIV